MKRPAISTMRSQVYQIIKESICNGDYTPGQWLQEKELAEQLSVSRSPVREALRQLAVDGLVIEMPNKGVFVKEFTTKEIEEVFDMRVLLENYAIEHIIVPVAENDKKMLHACIKNLEVAHKNGDLRLYITLDTELHEMLIKLCGNSVLEEMYEKVYSMIQQFRIYSLISKVRFNESLDEHRRIVKFVLEGDAHQAQAINKLHLQLARDKILDYLKEHKLSEDKTAGKKMYGKKQ